MAITLGADPELFVQHGDTTLFPAFEFLGSKDSPTKTESGTDSYWDGFQGEFTVTAAEDITQVVSSIKSGLKSVITNARKKDKTAFLSPLTVVHTPLSELATLPLKYTEFGCMPSFNAYEITGKGMPGDKVAHRFSGGHIHFGCGPLSDEQVNKTVRTLDALLGVAGVVMFQNLDDTVRREHYGLAGEYRLPPHGLEYRVLSNAWVFHPELAANILDFARKVFEYSLTNKTVDAESADVVYAILHNDVNLAKDILKKNKDLLDSFDLKLNVMEAIETQYPSINKIAENWELV